MARLSSVVAAVVATLLLATGVAQAAGPYPPPSRGSATVTPSRTRAGDCVVFSGNGFAPGATISITDDGAPAGTATANSSGTFSKQVCFRADAKRGRHVLTATGTGSAGDTLSESASLIVEGVRQSGGTSQGNTTGVVLGHTSGEQSGSTGSTGTSPGGKTHGSSGKDEALSNTGTNKALLTFGGVALLLLGSFLLLLIARRRRRDEQDVPVDELLA